MFSALMRAVLALVYFVIIVPCGAVARLFSDPLHIRRRGTSEWGSRGDTPDSLEEARRLG